MPTRVYDLAKELGIPNKEVIEKLKALGVAAKSQSSTFANLYADEIRKQCGVTLASPKVSKPDPKSSPSPVVLPVEEKTSIAPPPVLETKTSTAVAVAPPVVVAPQPKPKIETPPIAPTISTPPKPASKPVVHAAVAKSAVLSPPKPVAPKIAHAPHIESRMPSLAASSKSAPATPAASRIASTVITPSKPAAPPAPAAPPPVVKAGEVLRMKPPIVVKDIATRLGLKPYILISELMEMNIFATISQTLDEVAAKKVCTRHGVTFELEKRDHHILRPATAPTPEPTAEKKERAEDLEYRPPVVTFMGHVDHGKTSLLDSIRKANVAAKESGGITQHIGAYTVEVSSADKKGKRRITFLDTPGHEAFTAMRSRGANLTDVVVLVVSADDGVMPQTLEALNHARAAKVPVIVAVNKIDLPSANPERVKRQLQEHELTPEEWGGQTIVCDVSASTKQGLDHLLEMILLQAEILELKANPKRPAEGNVIESQMAPAGPTATVLVRKGTLKIGNPVLCGNFYGKVKALTDYQGKRVKEAGPSEAVRVLGLNGLPLPGEAITVTESLEEARSAVEARAEKEVVARQEAPKRVTLEDLFAQMKGSSHKELKLIIKADVQGSLEAISESLKKIKSEKISLNVIHKAVGPVSENDVLLASASDGVIIGFHVKIDTGVGDKAKHEGVQIKLYTIIYELMDQVEKAMEGLLEPEIRETILGHAEIKQVFEVSKGKVAGSLVKDGRIVRNARVRLLRRGLLQVESRLASLKRFQDDAAEVRAGQDCGIRLENFSDYQVGDIFECYQAEKVAQKL